MIFILDIDQITSITSQRLLARNIYQQFQYLTSLAQAQVSKIMESVITSILYLMISIQKHFCNHCMSTIFYTCLLILIVSSAIIPNVSVYLTSAKIPNQLSYNILVRGTQYSDPLVLTGLPKGVYFVEKRIIISRQAQPGSYQFRVQIKGIDGVQYNKGAFLVITKQELQNIQTQPKMEQELSQSGSLDIWADNSITSLEFQSFGAIEMTNEALKNKNSQKHEQSFKQKGVNDKKEIEVEAFPQLTTEQFSFSFISDESNSNDNKNIHQMKQNLEIISPNLTIISPDKKPTENNKTQIQGQAIIESSMQNKNFHAIDNLANHSKPQKAAISLTISNKLPPIINNQEAQDNNLRTNQQKVVDGMIANLELIRTNIMRFSNIYSLALTRQKQIQSKTKETENKIEAAKATKQKIEASASSIGRSKLKNEQQIILQQRIKTQSEIQISVISTSIQQLNKMLREQMLSVSESQYILLQSMKKCQQSAKQLQQNQQGLAQNRGIGTQSNNITQAINEKMLLVGQSKKDLSTALTSQHPLDITNQYKTRHDELVQQVQQLMELATVKFSNCKQNLTPLNEDLNIKITASANSNKLIVGLNNRLLEMQKKISGIEETTTSMKRSNFVYQSQINKIMAGVNIYKQQISKLESQRAELVSDSMFAAEEVKQIKRNIDINVEKYKQQSEKLKLEKQRIPQKVSQNLN